MLRAHKIRLNPTPEQAQYFWKASGVERFTYNWALGRWKHYRSLGQKVTSNHLKTEFMSNGCGYTNTELTLNDREWFCPHCCVWLDRDVNAARNIRDEAYRLITASR